MVSSEEKLIQEKVKNLRHANDENHEKLFDNAGSDIVDRLEERLPKFNSDTLSLRRYIKKFQERELKRNRVPLHIAYTQIDNILRQQKEKCDHEISATTIFSKSNILNSNRFVISLVSVIERNLYKTICDIFRVSLNFCTTEDYNPKELHDEIEVKIENYSSSVFKRLHEASQRSPQYSNIIDSAQKKYEETLTKSKESFLHGYVDGEKLYPQENLGSINTTNHIIGEQFMGDKNIANNVGIQGGEGHHFDNITINQQYNEAENVLDLSQLAQELGKIRLEIVEYAENSQHFNDISLIAKAEEEANEGNGAKAIECLSNISKWAWDKIDKIGIGLAVSCIKNML